MGLRDRGLFQSEEDEHADKSVLVQILQNLIANAAQAAKSLASPCVRIHSYVHGDSAVVSVRDNGPGIPPELQQRVFDPFFTTRRRVGGTGLGLALCREYAMRMRADISLWSAPGRGACFRVKMPRVR
jgi:signal transduction histidine kinase